MTQLPRVTFGIIVLNGEPFVRYTLRALYPFAHQIIVVEGAAPAAANIATADGHSTDATLATLRAFQQTEDPDHKLIIVTAEAEGHPDGFWPGEKHEQSQAYARRATGDYLWQVDIDEFYRPEDMTAVLQQLAQDPTITAVSFKQLQFWGGFTAYVDSWYLRRGGEEFHRLFRWGPGYRYTTHRPPTVVDTAGNDLRCGRWLRSQDMARQGIYLYHYSLVFPKQVIEKCDYYGRADWAARQQAQQWAQEVFLELRRPYRVHNVYDYPGWLNRFTGQHPPIIDQLRADIARGQVQIDLRPTADVDRLLASRRYQLGRLALRLLDRPAQWWEENRVLFYARVLLRHLLQHPFEVPRKIVRHLQSAKS